MLYKDRPTVFALFVVLVVAGGGLLFGYHTAILSGILSAVTEDFSLTLLDEGILVSIVLLGGLVGALFAGAAADRWGRKKVLLATALLFCIGTLIQAAAFSYITLFSGRFLTGVAVGISSVVSPIYLAEVAPPHHRGSFVSAYQLAVAAGILLAYALNLAFAKSTWHIVFYLGFVPSFVQFIGLFFIEETPGWLMRHSKNGLAVESLEHLRRDTDWEKHLPEMKAIAAPRKKGKVKQLMQPHLKRLLFIGLILSIFQQITGVNTVFYYAPKIFAKGSEASQTALIVTLVIGIANLLSTIVSVAFLDKLGRRIFLLAGIAAMIIGQILLTLHSPIIGITGAIIFVIGFAIGLGPILWVLLSEIYPLRIRGKAMGLALFANWLFNYIISLTFLFLLGSLGMSGTFILYAILSILCFIFVYLFVPETKGKSLEEIELLASEGRL